jgi:hypothetical protein
MRQLKAILVLGVRLMGRILNLKNSQLTFIRKNINYFIT